MRMLILGHSGHGKDRVARILSDRMGLTYLSASEIAARLIIFPALKQRYRYTTPAQCFADRNNHQAEWLELISDYNEHDPARFVKQVLNHSRIYCGLRSRREYQGSKHLFDHILWIDASRRRPKEPTLQIDFNDQEMIYINNNGPRELLPGILLRELGGRVHRDGPATV